MCPGCRTFRFIENAEPLIACYNFALIMQGTDITAILKGLGAAATSPLAFVGYVVATLSLAFLRARVERNKNLLQKLNALPEKDRASILSQEMGTAPVSAGLTPEQWIQTKTRQYYFLAFVILCILVVMLFAISTYENLHKPKSIIIQPSPVDVKLPETMKVKVTDPVTLVTPDPNIALEGSLAEIDLGVQRDFVVSKLGQPMHVAKYAKLTCTDYEFPFARIQLMFDAAKNVVFKYVVATDPKYQPEVLGVYRDLQGSKGCLGCFSFRDAAREPGPAPTPKNPNPAPGKDNESPDVMYFNLPATGPLPAIYVEKFPVAFSWRRELFLVHTSDGYDLVPDDSLDPAWEQGMGKVLMAWEGQENQRFDDFFANLPADDRRRFVEARGKYKPNAFAVVADIDTVDDGRDSYLEQLAEGKLDSVHCE
jgi:hypothetical protein